MSPSFACRFAGCTSRFPRKEHRNRHEGQHTGALARVCPLCARSFSRSDSLHRHVRLDHLQTAPTRIPRRTPQACQHCRGAKTRCSGGIPCSKCRAQKRRCVYGEASRRQEKETQPRPPSQHQHIASSFAPERLPTIVEDSTACYNQYIQLYFAHFHPHWPLLHRATFSPPHEPLLLLQVIFAIGLWITEKPSAREAAVNLHRKLGLSILEQQDTWTHTVPFDRAAPDNNNIGADLDPVSQCPVATYQAVLLYLIFSLILNGSNSPCSLNLSLSLPPRDRQIMSLLVQTCLHNRVFHYPRMLDRYNGTMDSITAVWVGVEELKRLGLAMYKVSRLCGSKRPLPAGVGSGVQGAGGEGPASNEAEGAQRAGLSLSDLQFPPPNGSELWEAQTNPELAVLLQLQKEHCQAGAGPYLDRCDERNWISQWYSGPRVQQI